MLKVSFCVCLVLAIKVFISFFFGPSIYIYACKTVRNVGLLFESYMLLGMSAEYSILIKERPDKYNRFSTGWDNRLKKLQQSR